MKKKSKRILSILLTIILVLTMMSAGVPTVSADTSGDYTYEIINGNAEIKHYTGLGGAVNIPSALDGYPVTSIRDLAFFRNSELTSLTIPNSVTNIGFAAFYSCLSLTSITIPNNVTSIGDDAFVDCVELTNITIPNSVTRIGIDTFNNCRGLTSVMIGSGVTSIGNWAFEHCWGLSNLTIGNRVTDIGDSAFSDCPKLTNVTIPNNVTSIGEGAFNGCLGLTSITIPNSVTSIGDYAFGDCSGLTNVTVPNSVTSIGDDAFESCSGLTLANFLGNAPKMGSYVFNCCAPNFTIYYLAGKTGFTTPTWCGYPCQMIGDTTGGTSTGGTSTGGTSTGGTSTGGTSTGGTSTGGTSTGGTSTVTSSAVSNSTGNNSTGGNSTEFSLQDDAYKFSNATGNFKSSYAISKQYVSLLEKGMSNTVKEQIDQYEANSWNGSCLGMSASLISFYNQNLSPVKWDSNDNAKNVHGLATPVTDDKVNNLINFYQLMAILPDNVERPKVRSDIEAFEDLVTYTKNIASGGPLVQFTFELKANKDSKDYTHTVVAYGITEFSTHYDILIADPDKEIAFFSVSKDFTTPKIVANPGETVPYSFISAISVINDPKEISLINPQTGASYVKKHDYTAPWLIILKDLGSLILSNLSGQSDTIVNGAVSGNLPIGNVKQISGGSDEGNEPFETFYELPKEDAYHINLDNPADINLSLCYVDTLEKVEASAAQSVSFDPSGDIELGSQAGKPFELSETFNNPVTNVPWSTVTVAGNAAATTSMEKTSDGIVVEGDGLSGITVTGILGNKQATVKIPSSEDNFLIKETAPGKTDMGIYLDSNNDGTYEKLAQTGKAIQTSSNTFAPPMLLVAVALVVVAVLLMLLMLLFLRKKRKYTPKFAVVNDYSPSAPVKHEYPKTNDEVRSAAPSAFKKADFSNEDDAKSTTGFKSAMKTTEKPIDSKEKPKEKEGNKYYSKPDDLD